MMQYAMVVAAIMPLSVAGMRMPEGLTNEMLCEGHACIKPKLNYETILDGQPGYQWNDAGGYCGSWSTQRAALMLGAYISQGQVRNNTYPGGGNDNEILSTNIEEALRNLHLTFEGFDYTNYTAPMQDQYFMWLKKQLVQKRPVVWMIMWDGQRYPIYKDGFDALGFEAPPAGMYGHVEPVMGIQSEHPLTDETVYETDVIVHYNDGGSNIIYRKMSDLAGSWGGNIGDKADCQVRYCIGPYSFGWALTGFADSHAFKPAYLHISPSRSEPDIRAGAAPIQISGTLMISELEVGVVYAIYRWGWADAFKYNSQFVQHTFKAYSTTYTFADLTDFPSDSATYYRVVEA